MWLLKYIIENNSDFSSPQTEQKKEETIELTQNEIHKIFACLLFISKDFEQRMYRHELRFGQDFNWQELKERRDYYAELAKKFDK